MVSRYFTGRLDTPSVNSRVSPTFVWALTLASVVLLLPVILLQPSRTPLTDAWLEFAGPESSVIAFNEAPPPVVRLELSLPWPLEEVENDALVQALDATPAEPNLVPAYRHFHRFEPLVLPLKSFTTPRHIQYKLDPSFGFDNRQLQLNGMMIRVWIDF